MEEYRNNSHKARIEEKKEEKRVEKVVTGEVKRKKKSSVNKFVDEFIEEDLNSVWIHVFKNVLIPAFKNTISDAINNTVRMMLFGETADKRKSSGSGGRVSYRSYYDDRNSDRPSRSRQRAVYDYDDIVISNRGEAEQVLDELEEILDRYRMVKVADFYEAVGIEPVDTDYNYGWTSLRSAAVIRCNDGGYMIKLPKAYPFD